MLLARMTALDEDAVICDFAETYHILNWRGLPLDVAATLACGLRDDSRIKMKMSKQKVTASEMMQAASLDALNTLVWLQTEDARRKRNKPRSILAILTQEPEQAVIAIIGFDTAEEFEQRRRDLLNGD